MTTIGPSGRVTKKRSRVVTREVNQAKVVLDDDLNSLHADIHETEDYSGTTVSPRSTQRRSTRRIRPTEQQQGTVPPPRDGLNALVIDLEAFDDDVQVLSSSRGFPPARNRSRRNMPVTVILDNDQEANSRISGESLSWKTTVNSCEQYPLKEGQNAKGKNVVESKPGPGVEPTFTCPVCMSTLVEASSTACGHIFCKECIKASIKTQKKCPTCRKKLNMNNFHRVYFPTTA